MFSFPPQRKTIMQKCPPRHWQAGHPNVNLRGATDKPARLSGCRSGAGAVGRGVGRRPSLRPLLWAAHASPEQRWPWPPDPFPNPLACRRGGEALELGVGFLHERLCGVGCNLPPPGPVATGRAPLLRTTGPAWSPGQAPGGEQGLYSAREGLG